MRRKTLTRLAIGLAGTTLAVLPVAAVAAPQAATIGHGEAGGVHAKSDRTDPGVPNGSANKSDLRYDLSSPDTETLGIKITNAGSAALENDGYVTITAPQWSEIYDEPDGCTADESWRTISCDIGKGLAAGDAISYSIEMNVYNFINKGDTLHGGSVNIVVPGDPVSANNFGMFGLDITDDWWSWFQWHFAIKPFNDQQPDLTVPPALSDRPDEKPTS